LDAEREDRVNEIAAAAGFLEPAARAAYLDQTCADNGELRKEVERVISEQATVVLDPASARPPLHSPVVTGAHGDMDNTDLGSQLVKRLGERRSLLDSVPDRYEVVEEVARGGQGIIYRVWDGDLRRHLAMKVVLGKATDGGTGTPGEPAVNARSLGRFLEEAQVTGQLDHPGIVPVHELALDAEGQLYFTMKLVKGSSLTDVFDLVRKGEGGWTTTRVLAVLQKVCDSMAYAHAKGVIHRDLKPANVMVGRFGEVYVMDWGLAKVLGQDDSKNLRIVSDLSNTIEVRSERKERAADAPDSSLVTMDGDVVGTPAYMSPEQARGELEEIGPATDVYALGAMMYQLLSGRMPYVTPGARVNSYALWQMVQQGPPIPVESLAPDTPVELAAICHRAMERRRKDRYRDMQELGEDLRAYVEGRVVRAYPAGPLDKAKKWIRRNKSLATSLCGLALVTMAALAGLSYANPVALAVIVAITLAGLVGITLVNMSGKKRLVAFLENLFEHDASMEAQGATKVASEILDRASQKIREELGREPQVQARLLDSMGRVHQSLGRYREARTLLEQALEIRRKEDGETGLETARTILHLARLALAQSRNVEAEELHREALTGFRSTLGPTHPETLDALLGLGEAYLSQDRFGQAEELTREVVDVRTVDLGKDDPETMRAVLQLASVCSAVDRLDEAEEMILGVVERSGRVHGNEHPVKTDATVKLVRLRRLQHRFADAEALILELIDECRRSSGEDHPRTIDMRRKLAVLLIRQARSDEAEPLLRELVDDAERILGQDHAFTLSCRHSLSIALLNLEKFDEVLELSSDVLKRNQMVFGPRHRNTITSRGNVARIYAEMGRYDEAEVMMTEATEGLAGLLGVKHHLYQAFRIQLASVLMMQGKLDQAEQVGVATLSTLEASEGKTNRRTLEALTCLTRVRWKQGRFPEAMKLVTQLLDRTSEGDPLFKKRNALRSEIAAAMRDQG